METLSVVELEKHIAATSRYTAVDVDDSLAPAERYMFFGTHDGQILYLWKSEKQTQRKPRIEDLGQKENKHTGSVTVLRVISGLFLNSYSSSSDNNKNILITRT